MKNKTFVLLLALCFPIALQAQLVPAAKSAAAAKKTLQGAVSAQVAKEYRAAASAFKAAQIKYDNTLNVYNHNSILTNQEIKELAATRNTLDQLSPLQVPKSELPNKLKWLRSSPLYEKTSSSINRDFLSALENDNWELVSHYITSGVVNMEGPGMMDFVFRYYNRGIYYLLDRGLNPNIRLGEDFFHGTMLHSAVTSVNRDLFNALMEHGGDLTIVDDLGNTPIFYAVRSGKMLDEILEQIAQHPEYLSALRQRNAAGRTPMEEALHLQDQEKYNITEADKYQNIAEQLRTFKVPTQTFRPIGYQNFTNRLRTLEENFRLY